MVVLPGRTTFNVPDIKVVDPGSDCSAWLTGTVVAAETITFVVPEMTVVRPVKETEGLTGMVVSPETTTSEMPPITVGLPVMGWAPMNEAMIEPTATDVDCDAEPWDVFGEFSGGGA